MRYSKMTMSFAESVRFNASQSLYQFLFPGSGNDGDSDNLCNLMGPNESSVRASVLAHTGESHAGFVAEDELDVLKKSAEYNQNTAAFQGHRWHGPFRWTVTICQTSSCHRTHSQGRVRPGWVVSTTHTVGIQYDSAE